jgi:glucose/arabinose dehydrogenase
MTRSARSVDLPEPVPARRTRPAWAVAAPLALALACGGGAEAAPLPAPPGGPFVVDVRVTPAPPPGSVAVRLVPFASGLVIPWGMAFLPDRRLLVTERGGTLRLVSADGKTLSSVTGVPAVDATGQGGLLDVALDPQFAVNRRVYLSFSEPGTGAEAGLAGTAVFRAELDAAAAALVNGAVIFRQRPKVSGNGHYGSRLVFRRDGTLFVTLGERQQGAPAQDLASQLGKVVRIDTAGNPAAGNPGFGPGASPHLWTAGHRNPQSAALHPDTGDLWVTEHGPQGGDEVNLALPGRNFGWPGVSYGCNYGDPVGTACRIGGGVHAPTFTEPLAYWAPTSTAPGAMAFYTGDKFPEWRGNLFVGGLAGATLWRLRLEGATVVGIEALFAGVHEIRDLRQGPDGFLYLLTRDSNEILRVER